MIEDPAALRDVTASFIGSLAGLDESIAGRPIDSVEHDLGGRIAAFARELGWLVNLRFRLRPLDFPRAGRFPQRLHQYTAGMRLSAGHDAELCMNSNVLDSGYFWILVDRLPVLLWLLGAVLKRAPETTADIALFPGDACFWNAINFSGTIAESCLVPDPDYFKTAGCAEFRAAMDDRALPPWESRRSAVLWRGSTSGIKRYWPPADRNDTAWLARLEFCARAQAGAIADDCDVGFTNLVQIPPDDRAAIAAALAPLQRPFVDKAQSARYKAVVDIDGNSNTWSTGLYCSLLSGACVIKIDSEHGFRQWYYDRLQPWIHYVPVKSDLSDLDAQVLRVLADDDLARAVGHAGRDVAMSMDFQTEMNSSADRVLAWATAQRGSRSALLLR